MDVALINEGTYPYVKGGVSQWCDKLIRGLPEHTFRLVTLVANGTEKQTWDLPANAEVVQPFPLWGPAATPRRGRHQARVTDAARAVLAGSVLAQPVAFEWGLRELARLAAEPGFDRALRSCDLAGDLLDLWPAAEPLTVYDAIVAAELVERSLLPLRVDLGPGLGLTHAVANGLPTLVGLAEKWRRGTPLVMSEHGVYLRERYLAFRELSYPAGVKTIVLGFLRQLAELGYRSADFVVPVARFNARWEHRLGADPAAVVPIYNGVEPERYIAIEDEPGVPTISWVGRVDPLKDLETLVAAFALVREQLPETRLRLFGPTPEGNEEYEQRCLALADRLGVLDGLVLEGPVPSSRIAFEAGHVVALSSISEGMPYTVIEAMMCGRATVSTDVGGTAEAVADAGAVVPPRDPSAFAEACLVYLRDAELRQRIGQAARERALATFTLDRSIDTYRMLYQATVGAELELPA
ncbi:GT4 family glycosyltransferase PelF [Kribbella sp. CA-253562]|uniref:GT4 family glycosyltransferase PelF n=1 Tax=Kribbella sp. CA-253562 TaxID=3239942 RepID=UPI003D905ADC